MGAHLIFFEEFWERQMPDLDKSQYDAKSTGQ
jgi:hypothetical protein